MTRQATTRRVRLLRRCAILPLAAAGVLMAAETSAEDLRIAIGIDPFTMDPQENDNTLIGNLQDWLCETLVYQDDQGDVHPLLATEWDSSEDGLTWTFQLRDDVNFHDGTHLDAEAVAISLNRLVDPDVRVPLRGWMGPLGNTEVTGDYEVTVTLDEPFAPFIRAMSLTIAAINSPTALEEAGEDYRMAPVCSGQYRFVEWQRGDRLVFERNDDYWGDHGNFDRIVIPVVPEAGTRMTMLLADDVDIAVLPPAPDIPALEANPDVTVYSEPSSRIMFLGMNLIKPGLEERLVRQAVNHAIDKDVLIERILYGQASPVSAPIPDFFFGHSPVGEYPYDPERARELLAEAGYENGLSIEFRHPTGRYLLDAQVSEAIQAMLAEVGIDAQLRTMDWPTYTGSLYQTREETDVEMYMLGWGPWVLDAHMTLYPHFHSTQMAPDAINSIFFDNAEVDRLLEEAAVELDDDKRIELYRDAMEIIWEEAPWAFLYVQNYVIAARADLAGIHMLPIEKFEIRDARFE